MKKHEIHAAMQKCLSEQNAIALEYGFTELITYTAKYYDNKPREPAQTGYNRILTTTAKHDIFYEIGGIISRVYKAMRRAIK